MGHKSGLWLCEHLIWGTPRTPSPSLLPVPHKDSKGVATVEQEAPRGKWSSVLHCVQALFLPVPASTLVLLVAVPIACPARTCPTSLVITHW